MSNSDQQPQVGSPIESIRLHGERLGLGLANTMDPRLGDHPHDHLVAYGDLVGWGRRVGILTAHREQGLLDQAEHQPEEAVGALARAKDLRETIYRVFSAAASERDPSASDLDALRRAYGEAMRHATLIRVEDRFTWEWPEADESLDCLLWPVARSAIELLMSPELPRVKECPGMGDCGWLFLDTSKNASRRWCSMEGCGSRVKMRRHYARKRAERGKSEGCG